MPKSTEVFLLKKNCYDGRLVYDSQRVHKMKYSTCLFLSTILFLSLNLKAEIGNGLWRKFDYTNGFNSINTFNIYETQDGRMWFGTSNGLYVYDSQTFENYTKLDGLPNNNVRGIYQTKDGKVWLGTMGGLVVYDDYTFETIQAKYVGVWDFLQTADDNLWFTNDDGFCMYDGQQFHHYPIRENGKSIGTIEVVESNSGELWFASTSGGVVKYDGRTTIVYDEADGLANKDIWNSEKTKDGMLWFGGGFRLNSNGLTNYDGIDFRVLTTADGLIDNRIRCSAPSKLGGIWLGTDNGISYYANTGRTSTFTNFLPEVGLGTKHVLSIYESRDGILWCGGYMGEVGLSQYDPQGLKQYKVINELGRKLENQRVNWILETDDLHILFATTKGIAHYWKGKVINRFSVDKEILQLFQSKDRSIWAFSADGVSQLRMTDRSGQLDFQLQRQLLGQFRDPCQSKDGSIWLDAGTDLVKFDGSNFEEFQIRDTPLKRPTFHQRSKREKTIGLMPNGSVWFLGENGVGIFDGKEAIYYEDPNWYWNFVGLVDDTSTIWIYGFSGVKTLKNGEYRHIPINPGDRQQITWSIYQDQNGVFWQGSPSGITSNQQSVWSIYEDRHGIIWLGSPNSITKYKDGKLNHFYLRDGHFDFSSYPSFETMDGLLIGLGSGGITLFDGQCWSTIDTRDGLLSNNQLDHHLDNDGNIWISSEQGVNRYKRTKSAPKVEIIEVKTNQVYQDLSRIPPVPVGNLVAFSCKAIDFRTLPDKQKFRYRINNQDLADASLVSWGQPTKYEQFEYKCEVVGQYNFQAQYIDRDLNYSAPVSLRFDVYLPWYMNGWITNSITVSLMLIVFVAIFLGVRYYRQRQFSQHLQTLILDEITQELAEAQQMQLALLPKSTPDLEKLQIAGQNIAAKEVGGDFFDYLHQGSQLLVAVGDVSGKGLKAAMNAVMVHGILNISAEYQNGIAEIMSDVNRSLCQSMERDMNVTLVIAQFDHERKQMLLANAGQHAYPLLIRDGTVEPIIAKGMALGMIPNIPYKLTKVDLESGDLLLFMTDGITEPRNAEGVMYEESGRFHQFVSELENQLTAEEVVDTGIQDVINYMADEKERDDDITLVAVKVT